MKLPNTLIISPVRLTETPKPLDGELDGEVLEIGESGDLRPPKSIEYQLNAQRFNEELLVTGKVGMELEVCCGKCAEFYSTRVVDSDFVRHLPLISETEGIELTGELRESLLLLLPLFPLCSESCRGLCPHCGSNLNHKSCDCEAPTSDGRWGGLDELELN